MKKSFDCPLCKHLSLIDGVIITKVQKCIICHEDNACIMVMCCKKAICNNCSNYYRPVGDRNEEEKWVVSQSKLIFGNKENKIYTIISAQLGYYYVLKRDYKYGPVSFMLVDDFQNYNNVIDNNKKFTQNYKLIE